MRKTLIIAVLLLTAFLFISAKEVSADIYVAEASATLKRNEDKVEDFRITKLENFLEGHNSPLAPYAGVFVAAADKYGLDWRLVPAIAGVESTFGKRIPYKSYNAYGWANGLYVFNSWEESIEIVSFTLRKKYIDSGAVSINRIARRYAPPSSSWAWKVKYFMEKIDPYPLEFTLEG